MRVLFVLLCTTLASAFSPLPHPKTIKSTTTALDAINRRDLLTGVIVLALPQSVKAASQAQSQRSGVSSNGSTWFFDEKIEQVREEAQMPTGGRLDLNNADVTEYKNFPGMYPHAAGQIASHGPYNSVSDIYKIATATETDKKMFKKYEREFTVNPPGRFFDERINQRQST